MVSIRLKLCFMHFSCKYFSLLLSNQAPFMHCLKINCTFRGLSFSIWVWFYPELRNFLHFNSFRNWNTISFLSKLFHIHSSNLSSTVNNNSLSAESGYSSPNSTTNIGNNLPSSTVKVKSGSAFFSHKIVFFKSNKKLNVALKFNAD